MTYREHIIHTIDTLIDCEKMIFSEGLNLLMNNELKEVNEIFEEGDVYEFDINHLNNSKDLNVQLIVGTLREIRNSIDSLQNINLIKDSEIEF